eukprot:14254257-Ditylum_brightwellii.AAC.1
MEKHKDKGLGMAVTLLGLGLGLLQISPLHEVVLITGKIVEGRVREVAPYWALEVCPLHSRWRDYGCLYRKHVPHPESLPPQDDQYFNERL